MQHALCHASMCHASAFLCPVSEGLSVRELVLAYHTDVMQQPPLMTEVTQHMPSCVRPLDECSMITMLHCRDDGVGLAAPQVGVNVRLMVYNPSGRRGDEEFILVNPKILNASSKKETSEEGCLSFPRIFADVEVRQLLLTVLPYVMALELC